MLAAGAPIEIAGVDDNPPDVASMSPIHFVALSTMMSAPCCVREVEMVCKVGFEL